MSTWLDLKNNPRLKTIYETRSQIIRLTREWFWSQGFLETDTPLAVRFPGQEPYLNPIPLTIHDARGTAHNFHLHTSPEYSLKKLLAAGFSNIFEITKTFRDGEDLRGNHSPEFTMLEWYRAPGTYTSFMDDMENLFKHIGTNLKIENLKFKNKTITFLEPWDRKSMREVWHEYIGIDLNEYLTLPAMQALAGARGQRVNDTDTYDDLFFKIFLNEIEPKLGSEKPIFIYDYPAQMCSLSRPASDPRYAERVECYIGGLEMCNGFGELTDAEAQEEALERDRTLRHTLGKEMWSVDPDFIAALRSGIPEKEVLEKAAKEAALPAEALAKVGGVALGLDRMVVLFTNAKDINEVLFNSAFDQAQIHE